MEYTITMKLDVQFHIDRNSPCYGVHQGTATLMGQTIASVEINNKCDWIASGTIINKLKKIIREINSNNGYSF